MNVSLRNSKKAFTLIELLVIIAVLAVLACVMLPAMATAKAKSTGAGCISNLRQMMTGWALYKDDNNDTLLPNAPAGFPASQTWTSGLEDWHISPANTNPVYYTSS